MIRLQTNNSNVDIKYPNIKGEDGGYYIPSVDENGVLSWTGSEEGMEEVATASIQGKDGEPGPVGPKGDAGKNTVWTGDEEPGEDYNVWIAPGGTPTYIMTAEQCQEYIDAALREVEDGSY